MPVRRTCLKNVFAHLGGMQLPICCPMSLSVPANGYFGGNVTSAAAIAFVMWKNLRILSNIFVRRHLIEVSFLNAVCTHGAGLSICIVAKLNPRFRIINVGSCHLLSAFWCPELPSYIIAPHSKPFSASPALISLRSRSGIGEQLNCDAVATSQTRGRDDGTCATAARDWLRTIPMYRPVCAGLPSNT